MVSSGPVYERLLQQKRHDDMNGSALAQQIAAAYLAAGVSTRVRSSAPSSSTSSASRRRSRVSRATCAGSSTWQACRSAAPICGCACAEPLDERTLYSEAVAAGVNFMPAGAAMPERPEGSLLRISTASFSPEQVARDCAGSGSAIRAARRAEAPVARTALPLA